MRVFLLLLKIYHALAIAPYRPNARAVSPFTPQRVARPGR